MAEEEQNPDHTHVNDLSCDEDYWSAVEQPLIRTQNNKGSTHVPVVLAASVRPTPLPQYRVELEELEKECWLRILLSKEHEEHTKLFGCCYGLQVDDHDLSLIASHARQEAVHWILDANSYHSFSAFTVVLAVNYLDRFLPSLKLCRELPMKPWMVQLVATACLTLAAKVEETHVPPLLDLQVDKSKYYAFTPKSIQRMELLVLSLLDWKMNPVIPLSFLSYIIEMVPLADHKHQVEFSALFEHFVLSQVLHDFRFVHYGPSVVAVAVTLRVMKQMGFGGEAFDICKNELCHVFQSNEEEFEACYQLFILRSVSNGGRNIANIQATDCVKLLN
ncbi:cyclin-D3-3-like [Juglans microcarpa x Juglans regia]|uniref:cyclin-D3-3-like n=1 Tax=Juglans microcarpa x Juglans regia TaxID=2249226 RepID=UPI001B7EF61A|nr:cyclin-D3-3-like [Juglans microcarpa x Juglans regia]